MCYVLPGLDYTRPAFGPCTAPGVPAASCKVLYMEDFAADDGELDTSSPLAPDQFHGTNVAGIITSASTVLTLAVTDTLLPRMAAPTQSCQPAHTFPALLVSVLQA